MATILNRDLFQLSPPHTSTRGPADAARRRNRLHTIDDVRVLSPGPGASVPVSGNQQPRLHLLMIQPPSPETGTRLYLLGHTIPHQTAPKRAWPILAPRLESRALLLSLFNEKRTWTLRPQVFSTMCVPLCSYVYWTAILRFLISAFNRLGG